MFAMYFQHNDTPLDLAVEEDNIDIIQYFTQKSNQDISKLQQVV